MKKKSGHIKDRFISRYQKASLYSNIILAAGEYVDICYETAITGNINQTYPLKLNMSDYIRWLSRILSYRDTAPQQLYLPIDMYEWVAGNIGLLLYPLINGQHFSVSNRIVNTSQLAANSKNELYLCSDLRRPLLENATHLLVERGAILKSTGDGMLLLLSW